MADFIKIAAKTALIAVVTAAIIAIFASLTIPGLDFTTFTGGLSTALAIAYHWCPALNIVFPLAVAVAGIVLALYLFHFAMIAVRWIFKVNE